MSERKRPEAMKAYVGEGAARMYAGPMYLKNEADECFDKLDAALTEAREGLEDIERFAELRESEFEQIRHRGTSDFFRTIRDRARTALAARGGKEGDE